MLRDKNGNIITDVAGKILKPITPPDIEWEINSNTFPPQGQATPYFRLQTKSGSNTVYFDYGDGSPIASIPFTTAVTSIPTYVYPSGVAARTVKMWFADNNNVSSLNVARQNFIGKFPENLLFYRINTIAFSNLIFDDFPLGLGGGIFPVLTLISITRNVINYIPNWITNSRVSVLQISGLNLADKTTNRLDKLIKIPNLAHLGLGSSAITTASLPTNFKNIEPLRTLGFNFNPVTTISQEINDCKQITRLSWGYDTTVNWTSSGNSVPITDWGVGIGGMNLNSFVICGNTSGQLTTTPPKGIEDCPTLRTIDYRSSYRANQARMDELVTNFYNKTVEFATLSNSSAVNGVLRKINFDISWINGASGANNRPSGTYQAPSGFSLGVNNGIPASAMEMLYVLVMHYKWVITIMNTALSGTQILS
ncbi:hypothetical protein [Epilithonimonas arachidiradicis]|uniref:Leucine rich repeat (LRR) protein n=1 Tax=Epilithonimonas arachidiradicis TaxID=1617282 RepID=A0A420DDT7_9FLAO|nr:hypothetical protein [Epilithonimonas arachidiradicis]RKE89994.1 hypothetical protein BXY58_0579 [Epilithonimonas arachidiradicis]GGG46908.1 hypothetical protein GCM10007332_05540 [Epilithonimonas arachidiradicis]